MATQDSESYQKTIMQSLALAFLHLSKGSLFIDFGLLDELEDYGFIEQPQKGRKGKPPNYVRLCQDSENVADKILSSLNVVELRTIWETVEKEKTFMQWGDWTFNARKLVLTHTTEGYEIDLEEIQSSADILDWIFQVLGKKWANETTIYQLLVAFEEILKPQANYCSFGQDKSADGGTLAKEFVKKRQKG